VDLRPTIERIERDALAVAKARFACAKVFTIGATDIDPRYFAVWVTTDTDAQRDALANDPAFKEALVAVIQAAGYPPEAIPHVAFAFESEETVQREWDGDWWACIK
jgi:hypothetical protein